LAEVTLSQGRCRLFEDAAELIEDGMRGPLYDVPWVAREHGPYCKGHPAPDQSIDKSVRRKTRGRRLEGNRQQRRNPGLGDEQRPTTEHHGGSHSQAYDDPDLDRPRPNGEHQEVGYRKSAGNPEHELDRPPPLLTDDDAGGDHSGYGSEERLVVPERSRSQKPRHTRRYRRLQDRPHPDPQPAERLLNSTSYRPDSAIRHNLRKHTQVHNQTPPSDSLSIYMHFACKRH
jgi:hypothetical protein